MKNYKMNFETKTLMVTREFADRLMSKGSEEYKIYIHLKEIVPDLRIAYKTHRTTKPNHNKGLTIRKMERFIKAFAENPEEILNEFYPVVEFARFQRNHYEPVVRWFRMQFPNFEELPEFNDGKIRVTPLPHEVVTEYQSEEVA